MLNKKAVKEYINHWKLIEKINIKELKRSSLKERLQQLVVLSKGLRNMIVSKQYTRNVDNTIINRWNYLKNTFK